MNSQPTAAGVAISLTIKTDDAHSVFQLLNGFENRRPFAEAEECWDVGNSTRRMAWVTSMICFFNSIINHSSGQDVFIVFEKAASAPAMKRGRGFNGSRGFSGLVHAASFPLAISSASTGSYWARHIDGMIHL